MADVSKIRTDGVTYNLKDATARSALNQKADKTNATTTVAGLMSPEDKIAINEFKSLRLSVDSSGYICQTVEVS